MLYFAATGSNLDALGAHPNIGIMTGPRAANYVPIRTGRPWASDCDVLSRHGYDEAAYFKHLIRMQPFHATCRFVVVPDLPGNGEATHAMFPYLARELADSGFPLAYVLQDGCETLDFPLGCDVAFLGGTDPWREAWGATLLARARAEGLGTHVGRVNSQRRVQALALTACDGADGTYVGFRGLKRGISEIGQWLNAASAPLFAPEDVQPLVTPERAVRPAARRAPGDLDAQPLFPEEWRRSA